MKNSINKKNKEYLNNKGKKVGKVLYLPEGVSIDKKSVQTEVQTVKCSQITRPEVITYPINNETQIIHKNKPNIIRSHNNKIIREEAFYQNN